MSKFKEGDRVVIRKDLIVGEFYYNEDGKTLDVFSPTMKQFCGQVAEIMFVTDKGSYMLDIDPWHNYTDEMLQGIEETENVFSEEVEELINHMLKLAPEQLINNAIDRGDKEEFIRLTEKYYKKCE